MNETFLHFGAQRQLVGTLTRPAQASAGLPAVLIPNTGIDHRVGPNRLHVFLGRAMAEAGFASLRIDLSGLGDSGAAPGSIDNDALADLRAAMDELARLNVAQHFIVLGICSGAHDAHRLAVADERVVAGAFIDGYAYPTSKYRLLYWMQRLADPARMLRRLYRGFTSVPDRKSVNLHRVEYYRQPAYRQMGRELAVMMQRRLPLWFLYTGQLQHEYNYAQQLTDAFPALRGYARLRLDHLVHADHTFSRRAMRAALRTLLLEWLSSASVADRAQRFVRLAAAGG